MEFKERLDRYRDIIRLRDKNVRLRVIAEEYGISIQRASQIVRLGIPKEVIARTFFDGEKTQLFLFEGKERTRALVRERDKYACQDCGKVRTQAEVWRRNKVKKGSLRSLDVHHLNGLCGKLSRSYDKESNIKGLTTLCHKCHYNRPEHRCKSKDFKGGRPITNKKKTI